MLFSVVIPMYNERAVIRDTVAALTGTLERAAEENGRRYEILFSDDGSDDGCGEIVREAAKDLNLRYGSVTVIRSEENRGKGAAVRRGMLEARGDWRLFTDSDLAYGAGIIPSMLEAALAYERERAGSCGALIGSRALGEDGYAEYGMLRTFASRAYMKLLSFAAGLRLSDSQCGIKLFRGDAAEAVFSRCETDGWAFDCEALLLCDKLGFPVREYPVRVLRQGKSKIRLVRDGIGMAREVGRIRRRVESTAPTAGKADQR